MTKTDERYTATRLCLGMRSLVISMQSYQQNYRTSFMMFEDIGYEDLCDEVPAMSRIMIQVMSQKKKKKMRLQQAWMC